MCVCILCIGINCANILIDNYRLQALVHTPLLSDYFMSDRHDCGSKSTHKCLVCEVSRLFQVGKYLVNLTSPTITLLPPLAGVLLWLPFAAVAASFVAFNLESCKAFGRL